MVRFRTRSLRRHVPAIATCLVIVWLAAVYVYSITGVPASARKASSRRLVTTALGGRAPKEARFEKRSRPINVDVRVTPTAEAGTRGRSPEQRERRVRPPQKKDEPTALDVGHSLPVAPSLASNSELKQPHHDYPALDLSLRTGTKVYAVTTGRVTDTTGSGACGNGIIIQGRDGFTYTYCHGKRRMVGRGRFVHAGDRIMLSGNTGDSTGPHLHLQIRTPYGKLVCPQHVLPAWSNGHKKSVWKAGRHGCFTGGHHHHKKKRR